MAVTHLKGNVVKLEYSDVTFNTVMTVLILFLSLYATFTQILDTGC